MKHIIFVEGLKTEEDKVRIEEELLNTRLNVFISLATESVTVEGSNDAVYTAKQAIQQAGYRIR
ncbi:copper chaperone [Erysipelothrix sp. HDW6A]|uniref:copper chaperone n=1 Tax=Erysipelothrix sp. HDW6A TaxID=2714928 RepID=UPI00140C56BC|nr:copper chaperone [Erysipelothrix sp. HDW6A]QIK57975.1 copper chaperone [Erysipelothrix sp. HDW6A]